MCGIVATIKTAESGKDILKELRSQFQDQMHRGKEGFGIVAIDKEQNVKLMRSTEVVECLLDLRLECKDMDAIILHHRFPTSTENKLSQTHPIFVTHKDFKHDYLVVHNGVMNNEGIRKIEHEKLGFKYTTEGQFSKMNTKWKKSPKIVFNDSEAVAIDLARVIEGKTKEIKSRGSMALIAVQLEKGKMKAKTLFWARKGNPLMVENEDGCLMIASEGGGAETPQEMLYGKDLKSGEILKTKKMDMGTYVAPVRAKSTDTKQNQWQKCQETGCSIQVNTGKCSAHKTTVPRGKVYGTMCTSKKCVLRSYIDKEPKCFKCRKKEEEGRKATKEKREQMGFKLDQIEEKTTDKVQEIKILELPSAENQEDDYPTDDTTNEEEVVAETVPATQYITDDDDTLDSFNRMYETIEQFYEFVKDEDMLMDAIDDTANNPIDFLVDDLKSIAEAYVEKKGESLINEARWERAMEMDEVFGEVIER